jgi:hypothetical protein
VPIAVFFWPVLPPRTINCNANINKNSSSNNNNNNDNNNDNDNVNDDNDSNNNSNNNLLKEVNPTESGLCVAQRDSGGCRCTSSRSAGGRKSHIRRPSP